MRVLISAINDENYEVEAEISQLNYSRDKNNFWMPCVMGDDWLQRINSSHTLSSKPSIVRIKDNVAFVVFSTRNEAVQFHNWLIDAEERVLDGYRTMRG